MNDIKTKNQLVKELAQLRRRLAELKMGNAKRGKREPARTKNEERFRRIFDESPIAIELFDSEGRLVDANKACLETFGVSDISKIRGLKLFEDLVMPKERKEKILAGETVRYETQFDLEHVKRTGLYKTTKSGHMHLDVVIAPMELRDEATPFSYLVQVRDITTRRQAEEALRKERDFASRLMETSPVGITAVNREGEITFANRRAEQILGLSRSEITRRSYNTPEWRITTYDGAVFPDEELPFRRVITTGQPVHDARHAIETADGQRILLSINGVPLFDESGQAERVVFAIEDVTERIRLEKALRQSHQELEVRVRKRTQELEKLNLSLRASQHFIERVADTAPGLIYIYDIGGLQPEYLNRRASEFFGHTIVEARQMGRRFFEDYIHPDDLPAFKNLKKQFATADESDVVRHEMRVKHGGGEWRWLSCLETVFTRTPDGAPKQILGTALDITERKEADKRDHATHGLLDLFIKKTSRKAYLDAVVELLAELTGCQATGVRVLNARGQIPYEASIGFTEEFLQSESFLSLDKDVCVCTRVILGAPDPQDAPAITRKGSFVCSHVPDFVITLSEEERSRFRGVCIKEGYTSVAVIPIRYRDIVLGAVHIADHQSGMIEHRTVEFLESLIPLIGEAAYRFNVEDALRESEERYRNLVELSPDAVTVVADGKIVYTNRAGVRLFGASNASDILGKRAVDFLPSSDHIINQGMLRRIRNNGMMPHTDLTVLQLNGSTVDVESTGAWVTYQGKPAILGVTRDVSERKRAEAALRESRELLERTFSNIHLLVAYLDKDFHFLRVNTAYAEANGHKPQFFVGKNLFALYPDEENEAIFRRVVKTGKPYSVYEKRFVYPANPGQAVTYWDWSLQPVKTSQGKVSGLILSLRDVTERKRTQAALVESERQFHAIFDHSFEFIYLLSLDGTLLEANRPALAFGALGYKDVVGHRFWNTPWWRGSPQAQKRLKTTITAATEGNFVRYETELKGAGNKIANTDFSITPIRDEADKIVLLIAEARDISEQKNLQKQVLETRAAERAKIGRDLHDILGQHLTAIAYLGKGLAQRLAASSLAEASDATRLSTLASEAIAQTRALAKGLCPVELGEEGLMAALEQLSWNTDNLFGISCRFRCDGRVLVRDTVTAMHLYHIAQEAVSNAIKHSQATEIQIRLAEAKPGVVLTVKDNGTGLPQDPKKSQGMGLHVMRHRASEIGAVFDITNLPSSGAVVLCWVPRIGDSQHNVENTRGQDQK